MPKKDKTPKQTKKSLTKRNKTIPKIIAGSIGLAGTLGTIGVLSSASAIAYRETERGKMIQSKSVNLCDESIKNKGYIPKIIHQIWIGDQSKRPQQIMDTWKKYCEENSSFFEKWEYRLWTDKEIQDFGLKNKTEYLNTKSYPQKADIARYEIMEKYGGFYIDADMYAMGHNFEKFIDFNTHFIGVMEPFGCNSFENIQEPYIANGFFACTPRHPIMQRCVKNIPQRMKVNKKVYIQTGPGLLNEMIYSPITILPSKWVFPVNFKALKTTNNIESFKNKALVFTKSGYEVSSLKNAVRKVYE